MNDGTPQSFLDNPILYEGTYLEFLGFRLTEWKEGFARVEMNVRPEHRNTVGYLHGGVISSLLDIAGAVAGSYGISNQFVSVTINLNCNFMSPLRAETSAAERPRPLRVSLWSARSRNCSIPTTIAFAQPPPQPTSGRSADRRCRSDSRRPCSPSTTGSRW